MSEQVKQLEGQLNEVKVKFYDAETMFEKFKENIKQQIGEIEAKIEEIQKGNQNEVVEENQNVQGKEENSISSPVVENAEQNGTNTDTPEEVNLPLIQADATYTGPQTLDQTPLVPSGIELPKIEEKETPKQAYKKIDSNTARPISTTEIQGNKLRQSKGTQKELVFGQTVEEQIAVPEISTPSEPQAESLEEIDAQMKAMVDELASTTDERLANELNCKIGMLNEKKKLLTKVA